MRVFEIMTDRLETVPPAMAASEAWERMRLARIHHLVVKDGARMVGVLSDRDLGSGRGAALRTGRRVADLMTAPVATVEPNDTVRRAANLMRGRTIGCLPVVRRNRLLGIVTVADLLDLIGRGFDRPGRETRSNLHYRVPHRRRARSW
jgi:acetoin utilization protein AcuB